MSSFSGIQACVFDAYGTLFDVMSALNRAPNVPETSKRELAALWRDRQLQYSWLRTIQNAYADFEQVTADALSFALETLGLLTDERHRDLMALYDRVPAFAEVSAVLRALSERGLKLAILSNGTERMLASACDAAGLIPPISRVLSADSLKTFKTDSRVYAYCCEQLSIERDDVLFVSSNGWDAHAAAAFGMQVAWCNRTNAARERLPGMPDLMISNLTELLGAL